MAAIENTVSQVPYPGDLELADALRSVRLRSLESPDAECGVNKAHVEVAIALVRAARMSQSEAMLCWPSPPDGVVSIHGLASLGLASLTQTTAMSASLSMMQANSLIGSTVTVQTDSMGDTTSGVVQSVAMASASSGGQPQININGTPYSLSQVVSVAPTPGTTPATTSSAGSTSTAPTSSTTPATSSTGTTTAAAQ